MRILWMVPEASSGQPLPAESPFLRHMRGLAGVPTFFEPLHGNHGDRLIRMGAEHVMRKAGVELVDHAGKASAIVLNGGGSMNDVWWEHGVDILERLRREHPGVPLTVAPQSYMITRRDFAAACHGIAPVTLFCREHYSADHLHDLGLPAEANVQVSQDLAFELLDSDWLRAVSAQSSEKYVLVVVREDKEIPRDHFVARVHARWLPPRVRRHLGHLRDGALAHRRTRSWLRLLEGEGIGPDVEVLTLDLSAQGSFDDFVATVRDARLIATDRLHVGILGHMLGKRVLLRPGVYHKIRGIYEMNMSDPTSRTTLLEA